VVVSEPASKSSTDLASWMRPDAILLHIGVHKTGTTAIQSALAQAGEPLAAAGIAYPAPRSHFDVGMAALGRRAGWDRRGEPRERDRWLEVVRKARRHSGRVLFSSEVLCEADDATARLLVDELGAERVQVLITLRPLEALLPSTWQQYLKSGFSEPYGRWLRRVLKSPETKTTPSFWRRNDHGRLVERWGALVGADDVALLVVDPLHRDGLYRDFECLLGLPEQALTPGPALPGNRSLSAAEAEALRRFNRRMRDAMPYAAYHRLIRRGAALALVEGRRPSLDEPPIVTPAWAVRRARQYGEDSVRRILATGSPVFGRVEVLTPSGDVPEAAPGSRPREIPVDIAPLLLEGAVRASLGERHGEAVEVPHSSGLALVPWRDLTGELITRVRRRARRGRG
jgi:hypothetical protein